VVLGIVEPKGWRIERPAPHHPGSRRVRIDDAQRRTKTARRDPGLHRTRSEVEDRDAVALAARAGGGRARDVGCPRARPRGALAQREGVSRSYFTRLVRLSYLAPDITRAILDGRQPRDLTEEKLREHSRLPLAWHDQRTLLGFA